MKYNSKYDRWVTKGGLVYRYSKSQDKLILCKLSTNRDGYHVITVAKPKRTLVLVHRIVYETFNGEITQGYQIDHINTIRNDNRVENLRITTPKENTNNPLTIAKHKGLTWSEFGRKFKEHFGLCPTKFKTLYSREWEWYKTHNKVCRWEQTNE